MKYQIKFMWEDCVVSVLPADKDAEAWESSVQEWLDVGRHHWVGQKFGEKEMDALAKQLLAFLRAILPPPNHLWERPVVTVLWDPSPATRPARSWVVA